MKKQVTLNLPDHFVQICEFMEISPAILLEEFIDNILSFDNTSSRDSMEQILAIRYFLTCSENWNKFCDGHVRIKEAFISKTIRNLDGFLNDMDNYEKGRKGKWPQEFLADWQVKWKAVIEIYSENDQASNVSTEVINETASQDSFTQIREIPPFESICLDTFADVVLQTGASETILIESKAGMAHFIGTKVENKRLWVSTGTNGFNSLPQATLYITYVSLNGLVVDHSGNITCKEPVEMPRLGIIQNGGGNIFLNVDVLSLDVTSTKTGNVFIAGCTDELKVLNHGSGKVDGSKLETASANVTIRGSGSVSIQVEDELIAILQGTGDLMYKGTPRLKSLLNNGTGRLKQM